MKSNKSKNFFREIAFLVVLNFFPSSRIDILPIWNSKKWNLVKKNFREIDFFYFTSFFGLDFFKFSGLLWSDPSNSITKCDKVAISRKKNSDLFDFTLWLWFHEFFALDFFKFSGPLCSLKKIWPVHSQY